MLRVRIANYDDLESLNSMMYELHDYHHRNEPDHIKSADESLELKNITHYLDSPDCLVYVAEMNEEVVGFVTGHFCELTSIISQPVFMGSVDELWVCPSFRQQGIAQALCDKLDKRFAEYGVKRVFVEVWDFNQSAIAFYQKARFKHQIHMLYKDL